MRTAWVFALLSLTSPAWADAVPSPPTDCLAGTLPDTCHGGPHCRPLECKSDADCDGVPCRAQRVCVDEIACGGLRPLDAPPPPRFKVVRGECSDDCGRCESLSFCGAKATSLRGLFGCGGASTGTGLGLAAAISLLVLGRVRGRREDE